MAAVMKFFDMKPTAFKNEWQQLTDTDKEQLKSGIADGTLTY